MKSFEAGLVLALSLGLALAAPPPSRREIKELQAIQECNATNPVQREPSTVVTVAISFAQRFELTQEEKCFLFCTLQKLNFLNENADIKNGPGFLKYAISSLPELANYAHQLIADLYIENRSNKGIEDKCQKAMVTYHNVVKDIFKIAIAEDLNKSTNVKEKIVAALENKQPVDPDISKHVEEFLNKFSDLLESLAKQAQAKQQTIAV